MSQPFKARRFKHTGAPVYLGQNDGEDVYSSNINQILSWCADGWRTRFNQARSTRQRYQVIDGQQALDGNGDPLLVPIGREVTDITNAEARKRFSFLASMPDLVLHHAVRQENESWFAAGKRRKTNATKGVRGGRMPGFRSRKRDPQVFGVFSNGGKGATITRTGRKSAVLTIKGQNPSGKREHGTKWQIKITLFCSQVPDEGFTSAVVNLDRHTATLTCPPKAREHKPTGKTVGVDRGIIHAAATSEGEFYDLPDTTEHERAIRRLNKKLGKARHRSGKRHPGGARYAENKRLLAAHHAKVARIRKDWAHKTSAVLVQNSDVLVFENLDIPVMTRRGRGSRELRRRTLASAWGELEQFCAYKAKLAGVTLASVEAKDSSRTCAMCGHVAAANRESQAVFRCRKCHHTANADVNAARVLVQRYLTGRTGPAGKKHKTGKATANPAVSSDPQTPALLR